MNHSSPHETKVPEMETFNKSMCAVSQHRRTSKDHDVHAGEVETGYCILMSKRMTNETRLWKVWCKLLQAHFTFHARQHLTKAT